jgi:carboxylate-amine ligase
MPGTEACSFRAIGAIGQMSNIVSACSSLRPVPGASGRRIIIWVELPLIHQPPSASSGVPAWAEWHASRPYTVGLEEEVMLLEPEDGRLAHNGEEILARLSPRLADHASAETHDATIELAGAPHESVQCAAREAASLRVALAGDLAAQGLRAASAGTHPLAMWTETQLSRGARYQLIHRSMRELARREPTFALHVHIGVPEPEAAIRLLNRLRAHVPLLLALSANSPFWQGRDTGLASARTPIFQSFPRSGVPRAFRSYHHYVETVDLLLRCDAFPAANFLWWDVRPQPGFGTVELRVMDAQSSAADTAVLAGLVQTIAHLELEEGFHPRRLIEADEVIGENRFLAARDGMDARFIDPVAERQVSARELLVRLVEAGRAHAEELGCEDVLADVGRLAAGTGADRQRALAERGPLREVPRLLSDLFTEPVPF